MVHGCQTDVSGSHPSTYRRKQFIETKNLSTESRAARGRETVPQDAFDTVSGTHRHRLDVHTLLAKILRFVDMPRRALPSFGHRNIQRRRGGLMGSTGQQAAGRFTFPSAFPV